MKSGLLPPRAPDLNTCEFYLWGMLKDKLHSNSQSNEDNPKKNQALVSSFSPGELRREINLFLSAKRKKRFTAPTNIGKY